MLFKQNHLAGIKAGQISLAFRRWKKPTVKQGSLIKTPIGVVAIVGIEQTNTLAITEQEAQMAGFDDLDALLKALHKAPQGQLYKIQVAYHAPDPRIALRRQTEISEAGFALLNEKTRRLDQYSKVGPWTKAILNAIRANPKLKAADLAVLVGKEKEWLKTNIRKLKNLGLTISHNPGYEISPLGKAYLEALKNGG